MMNHEHSANRSTMNTLATTAFVFFAPVALLAMCLYASFCA